MGTSELLEWIAVGCNLVYVLLLMKEHIACWFFGILGSAISIYLFYTTKLYSESILYLFYVIAGIYGWYNWSKPREKELSIVVWPLLKSIIAFCFGGSVAVLLGWYFSRHSDAESPWFDATTTGFSFLATYLETQKVLSAWVYWIMINAGSAVLYAQKDLNVYAAQMAVFSVMSVLGFLAWKKRLAVV